MALYVVTVTTTVEGVEAESEDEAIEAVMSTGTPEDVGETRYEVEVEEIDLEKVVYLEGTPEDLADAIVKG